MDPWRSTYLQETIITYQQHEKWANGAIDQIEDDKAFFQAPGPRSHSIAITVKHVTGNLRSRWKHFLTEDGEKPDRERDNEFVILPGDSRASLMQAWRQAWKILYDELGMLRPEDLDKNITIRGESLSVIRATQRSLAHTAYHTGQIMYLCRLLKEGEWKWLTIAPGESEKFNKHMGSAK
jgi:uncharacterized damage-inducible protein DinB